MAVEITSWAELNAIRNNLSGDYVLMNNLDSSSDGYNTYASSSANGGEGWLPPRGFSGTFDGNNKTISDLYINRPNKNYIGLFGHTNSNAIIKNIGLENVNINGYYFVGGLVGYNYGGISNSYSTGNVTGDYSVGGLVGNNNGEVSNSYSTGNVIGLDNTGGLIGYNDGVISNSYSTGSVTGKGNYVGGLVGDIYGGTITNSYYDKETSGKSDTGKGEGKTTADMKKQATFTDWDFDNVWMIDEGISYPKLGKLPYLIFPDTLQLTLSQKAPSFKLDNIFSISRNQLATSLKTPTILKRQDRTLQVSKQQLTTSLKAPNIKKTKSIPVSKQQLALSLKSPTIKIDDLISPSKQQLSLSLKTPIVSASGNVSVPKQELNATIKTPLVYSSKTLEVGKLDLSLSQKEPNIIIDRKERVIYSSGGYRIVKWDEENERDYKVYNTNVHTGGDTQVGTDYNPSNLYWKYVSRVFQRIPINIPQNETIISGKLVINVKKITGNPTYVDLYILNNQQPSRDKYCFEDIKDARGGTYDFYAEANTTFNINLNQTTLNFLNGKKGQDIGIGATYYEGQNTRRLEIGGFYLVLQTEILPVVVKPSRLPLTADLKPASLQYDSTIPQSKQELSSVLKTPTILKTKDFEASKLDLSLSQKSPKFEVAKPLDKQNLNLTQKDVTLKIGGSTKPNKLPLTASLKSPSIVFGRTYLPETLNLSTKQKNIVTRGDNKFQINETQKLTSAYKLPVVNEELTLQLEKLGLTTDLKSIGFTADWKVELNKALEIRSSQLPLNYEMKVKRMVVIGGVEVLNEWTNIKKVISYRIEDLIEDAIPKVNIELSRDVLDISPLRIGSTIEIFEGEQNPVRLFYGYITNKKPTNSGFEVDGLAETMKLLRGRINKVYTSSEDHHGENSEIAKDIIQRAGLVPEVVPTGTSEGQKIDEFRCSNASPFERLSVLQKAVNYQIRYDPINRRVYYEPRGFNKTNQFITTKYNTIGLPEWSESDDGMINDLLINGATTDTTKTESGIIGTDEGYEVDGIELTKVPLSVELIVNGDQQIGGSKDGSAGNYYWVDFEKKKIMPRGTFPNGANIVVNYVWSAPSPVRITNNLSINEYGLYQEEYKLSDVTSVFDAEARCREIVANRSKPFTTGKIRVIKSTPVKVGDYIKVNDNFSKKPVNDFFVVRKVVNSYPSAYNEIELGDKEFRLEDDFIELEARVKRLEELLISNDDIVTEFIELGNEESFIKPRYFAIYTGEES